MATRKSARLDAKANVATTQLVQNEAQNTTEEAQGSRNSKRRKFYHEKDVSGIKRKRGDSNFPKDVPLDILIEIFGLLEPIDLLYLSRVSKSLHGLLSSNDMAFVWKLAYKNIGGGMEPPPCPDDINIVFYTNYLYGRHCQFCCSVHGQIYHESALIRLCSKCAANGVDGLRPSVSSLCNVSTVPKLKRADLVVLKVEYGLRKMEFNQAREKKETESYSRDRKVDVQNRASLSNHLCEWREAIQTLQLLQLRLVRATREVDIRKKIIEEGYKNDFHLSCADVYRIPHIRKSHPLTDSEWSIIRADILDYFQDFRDGQALYDMQNKLQTRINRLDAFIHPKWKIHPTAWWIVTSSEPIASFIKNQPEVEISMEDFEKFMPQLSSLIASWREETDRYLTSLISDEGKQKDSRKDKTNRLKLATTFFKCRNCEELFSYPDILTHDCLYGDWESGDEEDDDKGDSKLKGKVVVKTRGPREPRPPRHLTADMVLPMLSNHNSLGMCAGREEVSFDKGAFNAAWDIITTCGEDPNTVTHDAMKQTRANLECLRCKHVQYVMKWRTALVHELQRHRGESPPSGPLWLKIIRPPKTVRKVKYESHRITHPNN